MIQEACKCVSLTLYRELKITGILKSGGWRLERSELPLEQNFFIAVGVLPVELLPYQISMVCTANWPR